MHSRLQGELGYAGMPNRSVMKSADRAHRLWPAISLFLSESYGLFRCVPTCATHSETSHSLWRATPVSSRFGDPARRRNVSAIDRRRPGRAEIGSGGNSSNRSPVASQRRRRRPRSTWATLCVRLPSAGRSFCSTRRMRVRFAFMLHCPSFDVWVTRSSSATGASMSSI